MYKNDEMYNLMQSLNVEDNTEGLRYDKVILATDADVAVVWPAGLETGDTADLESALRWQCQVAPRRLQRLIFSLRF